MEELVLDEESCLKCESLVPIDTKFCINCGYPQRGDVGEKAKYNADKVLSHAKSKEAPRLIRKARNTLFAIAALNLLVGLFYFFAQDDIATCIISIVLAIAYVVLGFWSQQKPLIALVLGLFVYLMTIAINAIVLPASIFSGLLIKIIVILFLAKGINSALHLKKIM